MQTGILLMTYGSPRDLDDVEAYITRVRGGPFASRADADKARDKLKGIGLNGNVIPQ